LAPSIDVTAAVASEAFVDLKADITRCLVANASRTFEAIIHIRAGGVHIAGRRIGGTLIDNYTSAIHTLKSEHATAFKTACYVRTHRVLAADKGVPSALIHVHTLAIQERIPVRTLHHWRCIYIGSGH